MIQLTNVSKAFAKHDAVTGLNLTVGPGKTVGFVGANGAGKTTTIRLMLGFLRPTAGLVGLMGCDMAEPREARSVRSRIGYVPDGGGLDPVLTGQRLLDELAALQQAPPVDRAELVDGLQLSQRDLNRPIGRLSRGTRQKINLIQGLQHRPDLLILDEPTEGLDPFAKRALFELLHGAKERGTTIFFSSHVLSEVEEICNEVALIRQGKLVDKFELNTVAKNSVHKVQIRWGPSCDDSSRTQFVEQLKGKSCIMSIGVHKDKISFQTTELSSLLQVLSGFPITELKVSPLSLEERVLDHYRQESLQ